MIKRCAGFILIFILLSLCLVEKAFCGAWTVPKYKMWGEYYMKWNYAKDVFGPNAKLKSTGNNVKNFRSWEFVQEPKIEYGITDYLNFMGSIEYKEGHYKEYDRPNNWDHGAFSRKNNGISNIKLGGKWRFLETPAVMSLQGRFFIYPGYGNYHGDDRAYRNQPSIGYGDDAFEIRYLIGKTFKFPWTTKLILPCYVGAETGYRWRNRHVCNDIPYFIEGGVWLQPWFLLKSEIDGYRYHPGTGSIKESYGIWRIGGVWQIFGDSTLRAGKELFNIEFQYGITVWGVNTNAAQEWVLKIQTQF